MPYKQTTTPCIVDLVALRGLDSATRAQCQALRKEAGRLWTALVTLHAQARAQGRWLSASDLEQATKGGQFAGYLSEKAARLGISVEWIDEAYSTRTCSHSGHVQPSSPRGRRFWCSGCGARVHRDVNGSANICSKAVFGRYSQIQADSVKYLRPIGVAPLTRATSS